MDMLIKRFDIIFIRFEPSSAASMMHKITAQPCKGFSQNAASFQSYPKERNSLNVSCK